MDKKVPSHAERVLLLGGGAREHAIGEALSRTREVDLVVIAHNQNPGLAAIASSFEYHKETDAKWIVQWAREHGVQRAVIGLEDPLAYGVPDALWAAGIPTVGPIQDAARLETSKLFARELMRKHSIAGRVEYEYFTELSSLTRYLRSIDRDYVLKPIGLTAGKGVKVMGDQIHSLEEAIAYGDAVIRDAVGGTAGILVEERLIGEEFTLQAFVDGRSVVPMPLVQDFKRAYEGDSGPNTGGMGSYSQSDGLLPFVRMADRDAALDIMRDVVAAVGAEGFPYKGVLYGQFMMTSVGPKVVEFNARFGDPEALNVLPLLAENFLLVCRAITDGELQNLDLHFARKATVCKYITPPGYGLAPEENVPLSVDHEAIRALGVELFYAKVDEKDGKYLTTSSRSLALVGNADTVADAEALVEEAMLHVHGRFHTRHDIAKGIDSPSDLHGSHPATTDRESRLAQVVG